MFKSERMHQNNPKQLVLPNPRHEGNTSVEEALLRRKSVREYSEEALELRECAQILWAAQGITDSRGGYRTAPSAGAMYPLEVYLVAGSIVDCPPGVYRYSPKAHSLNLQAEGDLRRDLVAAAGGQDSIGSAPASLVITAVFERTTGRYGERGVRYVHMDAGHAAENVYLQCVALGLGTVVMGAFRDSQVRQILQLPENEDPLYIVPFGKPKR